MDTPSFDLQGLPAASQTRPRKDRPAWRGGRSPQCRRALAPQCTMALRRLNEPVRARFRGGAQGQRVRDGATSRARRPQTAPDLARGGWHA
jgi:hypothetical protein